MENQGKGFLTIYDLGLKRKRWNCVTLSKEMADNGSQISARSLQRYRTGESRPSFAVAKEIFKALDIDATDDQIKKSLIYDSAGQKFPDENKEFFSRGVRIRLSRLTSDPEEDEASILLRLKDRIQATQPTGRKSFNNYITELIHYDMDHHLLPVYDEVDEDGLDADEGDD